MDINVLRQIIEEYNIIKRSTEYAWETIENIKLDDDEYFSETFPDYDKERITLKEEVVRYYVTNWPSCDAGYLIVLIEVYYKQKYTAVIEVVFFLNGELFNVDYSDKTYKG